MNTYSTVEPKVLAIFRSFVGVILSLGIISFVSSQGLYNTIARPGNQIPNLIFFILLFLYLSFEQIHRFLGRLYLPIALTSVTLALLVNQRLVQHQMLLAAKAN